MVNAPYAARHDFQPIRFGCVIRRIKQARSLI
jgi:hypothetical protein